jgi:hypothetical protein
VLIPYLSLKASRIEAAKQKADIKQNSHQMVFPRAPWTLHLAPCFYLDTSYPCGYPHAGYNVSTILGLAISKRN